MVASAFASAFFSSSPALRVVGGGVAHKRCCVINRETAAVKARVSSVRAAAMQRGLVEFAVLDKGLRSPNPGKQCEAILQFVPLLQRGSQVRRCLKARERARDGWTGDMGREVAAA